MPIVDLGAQLCHQTSQNNSEKQQENERKRRETFEQENELYVDVIQSRLFKDDFCKEKIDNVIEAIYKFQSRGYFINLISVKWIQLTILTF